MIGALEPKLWRKTRAQVSNLHWSRGAAWENTDFAVQTKSDLWQRKGSVSPPARICSFWWFYDILPVPSGFRWGRGHWLAPTWSHVVFKPGRTWSQVSDVSVSERKSPPIHPVDCCCWLRSWSGFPPQPGGGGIMIVVRVARGSCPRGSDVVWVARGSCARVGAQVARDERGGGGNVSGGHSPSDSWGIP